MAITQILDDRDPAVVYSSGWLPAGSSNEFNGTTTSANNPGLNATLIFQGIQVSVYGTLGPRNPQLLAPQSNYSIDGSTPVNYQAVQIPNVQYSTRFYISPLLPNGQHSLLVTNLIASDAFYIDYFLVLRADNESTTPPQLVPIPSTVSKSPSRPPSPEGKPSDTGTIVGAAIGAAALVILAVALILWLRGRFRRTPDHDDAIAHSFRENRSTDTAPYRQAPQSIGSTYLASSDSPPNRHSGQNPLTVYDPHEPSPPGYVPEVSQQSGARQYLPSKFTQYTSS